MIRDHQQCDDECIGNYLMFLYMYVYLLDDPLSHCVQASAAVPWLLEARTDFPARKRYIFHFNTLFSV